MKAKIIAFISIRNSSNCKYVCNMLFLLLLGFSGLKADDIGADDEYCQALLDENSATLKKTKAWKTCQGHDNDLLQCLGKDYKVKQIKNFLKILRKFIEIIDKCYNLRFLSPTDSIIKSHRM